MWYVMQTLTGKEEELIMFIRERIPSELYYDCFVIYYERIWRKQQESIVHIERLFPGYVFIISDEPVPLFLQLRKIPAMSKLMADGEYTFLPLNKEEEKFLESISGDQHVIRLSYVETDGRGNVGKIFGPLNVQRSQVIKYQFKKRYALVRVKLLGEEKKVALGILLAEDIRQEISYGKVEAPQDLDKIHQLLHKQEIEEKKTLFQVGDHITVISGELEHMPGIIRKLDRNTAEIGVHLFGQDMSMEVPIELIRKNFS